MSPKGERSEVQLVAPLTLADTQERLTLGPLDLDLFEGDQGLSVCSAGLNWLAGQVLAGLNSPAVRRPSTSRTADLQADPQLCFALRPVVPFP